jgi:hypothetical protein
MEVATSNEDTEVVCLLYDFLLNRRKNKIIKNKKRAGKFLSTMPDFYLEMNWDVHIPVLAFLCPKDTCKIYKINQNVRMDYTFVQFKSLKSVRSPSSYFFKENPNSDENDVLMFNWKKLQYFNPFEELDHEEKKLIIQDIMNSHRINGEFKLKGCVINESKSYWGSKPIYENVDGWNAQKYEVNITANINLHKKEKLEYKNLKKEIYFDPKKKIEKEITIVMNEKEVTTQIADNLKVKNDAFRNQLMKIDNTKDKKLKAYVWIAENFPIKSSVCILF